MTLFTRTTSPTTFHWFPQLLTTFCSIYSDNYPPPKLKRTQRAERFHAYLDQDSFVLRSQLCQCSVTNQTHSFSPPSRQRSLTPSTRWPWGQHTLQYPHETKLGLRNGGNCNGTDVTGANTITKKPNKQRNEVSRLLTDIRHTKHNEFAEINLRGLLLRKKRMLYSYVRTSMLLAKVRAQMSTDHTVPNRERWMTAMETRYLGLRRSGPVWRVN
jgi:hypothetical protein